MTKDELHALKRLKNDKDIVILPADKGRVTVVMDKDYTDKMDSLVNEKQTYETTEHHLKTTHTIDWDSATCLTYSTDYYQRINHSKAGLLT